MGTRAKATSITAGDADGCKCGKKAASKQKGECELCAKGGHDQATTEESGTVEENGLRTRRCEGSVRELSTSFKEAIEKRKLKIMASINHSKNAQKVGATLRPTTLLIFGNPKVGSKLMDASPTVAIDLPMKLLIWSNDEGKSQVAYNKPTYLENRHQLKEQEAILKKVQGLFSGLLEEVCPQKDEKTEKTTILRQLSG